MPLYPIHKDTFVVHRVGRPTSNLRVSLSISDGVQCHMYKFTYVSNKKVH